MKRTTTYLVWTSLTLATLMLGTLPASAQGGPTPPNLTVCDVVNCDTVQSGICSEGGFEITLSGFTPGGGNDNGAAIYNYQVCSPAAGVCDGTVRFGEACLDNAFCRRKGQNTDPLASCSRACAVDQFRGLSHFDLTFPELGAIGSCLSSTTTISGSCACSANPSGTCSVSPSVVVGDGSCFPGSGNMVAKCDNTNLGPGDCLSMTLTIAGELNGLGSGPVVVVDKEATTCTASCMSGPSCTPCGGGDGGDECLTRTIGFWGNHPWIANDYAPVTVCGKTIGCSGAATANANPSCRAGSCTSLVEGLCSIPSELSSNQSYVSLVRQLTAAKLNLNATAGLFSGGACSSFTFQDHGIADWIASCEGLCGADKATISNSGCIEALDAFNNSQDTGFDVTPSPFDRPPVNDFGRISGADSSECGKAHGNSSVPKLVIGKKVGAIDCR